MGDNVFKGALKSYITPRSHYHEQSRAMWTLSGLAAHKTPRYRGAMGLRWWSTWALRVVPCRTLGKPAERSHRLANQTAYRHRHVGRYSPRPSWCHPSRPRRLAYAELTGRLPLSSQYASSVPIRCILNASRADCTGWPCWRRRFAVLIRLHDPFASQQAFPRRRDGRTRLLEPSRAPHKC
jgi:hypothetical protein